MTSSLQETFGDIRAIVHGEPSFEAFSRLIGLIDQLDAAELDALSPTYLDPVRVWPVEMRPFPRAWTQRALLDESVPFIHLCATLNAHSSVQALFLETEHARHVRVLALTSKEACFTFHEASLHERPLYATSIESLRIPFSSLGCCARWRARGALEQLVELHVVSCEDMHLSDGGAREDFSELDFALEQDTLSILSISGDVGPGHLKDALEGATTKLDEFHVNVWHSFRDRGSPVDHDGSALAELLELPCLQKLEHLSVNVASSSDHRGLDDAAVRAIIEAPCAETLERLTLEHHSLTHDGVCALMALPNLERLDVTGNELDVEALQAPLEYHSELELVHEQLSGTPPHDYSSLRLTTYANSRLGGLNADYEPEPTIAYVSMGLAAGVLHALVISNLPDHPLPFWVPIAAAPALTSVRLMTFVPFSNAVDVLFEQPPYAMIPAEVRAAHVRGLKGAVSFIAVHGGMCAAITYLCILGGFASPHTVWSETVWWTFGTSLMFLVVVLVALCIESLGRALRRVMRGGDELPEEDDALSTM